MLRSPEARVAPRDASLSRRRRAPCPARAGSLAEGAYPGVLLAFVGRAASDCGGDSTREETSDVICAVEVAGGPEECPFVPDGWPPAPPNGSVGEQANNVGASDSALVLCGPPDGGVYVACGLFEYVVRGGALLALLGEGPDGGPCGGWLAYPAE
eukprot:2377020-Heterocapsa_arctica.AAC.1